MDQLNKSKSMEFDENIVRKMILNTIRYQIKIHKIKFGPEIIIACDGRHYWRNEIFKQYKHKRKKDREESIFDWNLIFNCLNKIREELKIHSPYKVIIIEKCEADDIIAVLVKHLWSKEKILIISGDKDFAQLQSYSNVFQYSPIQKKMIVESNPIDQLKELIIRGDYSDGIPNILSQDDIFVLGIRQKQILTKKLLEWLKQKPEEFCNEEMLKNYYRNKQLIDLSMIPQNISDKIMDTYSNIEKGNRTKFLNYLIENGLKDLIKDFNDF